MLLFETTIPADLKALSGLRKDVSDRLGSLAHNSSAHGAVLLALSEMGANALRHGSPAPSSLRVRLSLDKLMIVIEIEDDGGAFANFDASMAQARLADMAELTESGRGLSIVQSLLDDIRYIPGPPNRFIGCRALAHTLPSLLVVEDSPILLETYCAMLIPEYRVLRASNLETAIEITRLERVDGIVTDLNLNGREGSELADVLANRTDRPPVPVLVITGERDPDAIQRASQSGVEQILQKPVSIPSLRNAVAAMLTRSARQNARIFRYFGSNIDQDSQDRVPASVGPFRLAPMSARAGFGRGDFLCPLRFPGGKRLVLADVMGHGLAAQIAGMQFKAALRGIHGANPGLSAGAFVAAASRALGQEQILPGCFLTMIVIDLFDDGRAALCAAGHPRAILLRDDAPVMVESDGPLPGLVPDADYITTALELAPGERLFLVTDGLDPRSQDAGRSAPPWFAAILRETAALPFDQARDAIDDDARRVLTHSPVDDWTVLMIERGFGD